jgi:hypothetical protein
MEDDRQRDFWSLIRPHTGDVAEFHSETVAMSDFAAIMTCEKGPFFVKAMRNLPGGRRDSITREKLISPFVQAVSPELLWTAEDDNWIILGFEVVEGEWPSLEPDSPDLPAVVELLNRIGALRLPEVARDWHETRWDRFTHRAAEAELFRGDALLHADINHTNMIVGERTLWAVDWGWPTRGAAFIDPAMLVIQLVAAGHSAQAAESWATHCAAWVKGDSRAIDAFAAAQARMWREMVGMRPDRTSRRALAEAATTWAAHRGLDVT